MHLEFLWEFSVKIRHVKRRVRGGGKSKQRRKRARQRPSQLAKTTKRQQQCRPDLTATRADKRGTKTSPVAADKNLL